jgi:MoaA/NifB/PqqE/SkfB family radical SAM enzyme
MYPYVISVATHDFLVPDRFWPFIQFASKTGAREVHLLEPSAAGRLAGRSNVLLKQTDRDFILNYQREVAQDDKLPILSSFSYLESPNAFGCGAGLTHLYIDGSGEVCPCNLVPISFGNITREPLLRILDRMGQHFRKPRTSCVGCTLSKYINSEKLPVGIEEAIRICDNHLPKKHSIPRFFQVQSEAKEELGQKKF